MCKKNQFSNVKVDKGYYDFGKGRQRVVSYMSGAVSDFFLRGIICGSGIKYGLNI